MLGETRVGLGGISQDNLGKQRGFVAETLEPRRLFATITVTSTADTIASDAAVTLREAIVAVNNGVDTGDVVADVSVDPYGTNDTIRFSIAGSGMHTIGLGSDLPVITNPVTLDAYTQSDASPNTLAEGNDAVIRIEIDGNQFRAVQLGSTAGGSTIRGLAIFDALYGIDSAAPNTVVTGNFIGLRADGTTGGLNEAIGESGVRVQGEDNRIGGTNPADRNVISNAEDGVDINGGFGFASGGTRVEGNYIGTDRTGTLDRGSFISGVQIRESDNNIIGGTGTGARNVISGQSDGGIGDHGGILIRLSTGNTVQGNYIGTDVTGAAELGNASSGIWIDRAAENLIGGTESGAGNVISGNGGPGIEVTGEEASANVIQGNRIGTNAAGDAALPNARHGVVLQGPNSLLGGTESGAGNLISGNTLNGVMVGDEGKFTPGLEGPNAVIRGNIIGLDAAGATAIPNGETGIELNEGSRNFLIGGTDAGARNVISGNTGSGVTTHLAGGVLLGNYVGTDASGELARPNASGIVIGTGSQVAIGGGDAGEGNLISGNNGHGVWLESASNRVQGNRIGVSTSGLALGNTGYGVRSDGMNNLIGGANDALGNVIAYNGFGGVGVIDTGGGNSIRHNSIFSNTGLGIDLLGLGITPNDPGDADTGPNNYQNFPVIASAVNNNAGGTVITGTINSTPNTTLIIDFYTDTSAAAEGRTHVGSLFVTTDGSGNAAISFTTATALTPGLFLTATASTTATDPFVDTSEFSQAVQVAAAPPQTPPTATGLNNLTAKKNKGGKYAFSGVVAHFTSTAFNTAGSFNATINWGDGTSAAGQIVYNANLSRWEVIGSHQYARKGKYTLLITITDANGKTATATSTLTAK